MPKTLFRAEITLEDGGYRAEWQTDGEPSHSYHAKPAAAYHALLRATIEAEEKA